MSGLGDDIRALDRALQQLEPRPGLEEKILRRIDGAAEPRRSNGAARHWAIAGLAFAAGVAAAVVLWPKAPPAGPPEGPPDGSPAVAIAPGPTPDARKALDGTLILDDACIADETDAEVRLANGCRARLDQPRIDLEVWAAATVSASPRGLTLQEGTLLLHVAPVLDGATPVRVNVTGGAIEVLGTRFVVSAIDGGGTLDLLEGAVRFRDDGGVLDVVVGHRHAWGSLAMSAAPTEPEDVDAPRSPTRLDPQPGPDPDLAQGLAEVARLRQQGKHAEAVKRLRTLGRRIRDRHAREVLSFEEGTLLEKFKPSDVACAHWNRHIEKFGTGSYASEITRRRARLGCG